MTEGPLLMQVMAGAATGGAETFFSSLTLALHRAGQAQVVAIRHHKERAERLRQAGLEVFEFPFGGLLDWRTRPGLGALAKRQGVDAVLCWMSRASQKMPPGPYKKLARIGGYYDLKSFRDCDHIVCITPKLVDFMVAQGWPKDKCSFLPNFATLDETAAPLERATYDTPQDAPLLLSLGRLHRNKALDVLLHALVQEPRAYLWLAGDGPEEQALKGLTHSLGLAERVRFLGWREDRSALLKTADICVFPSRIEGFGTVTPEAWAHRCPLIAADAEGPAQFVRNEDNGLLVPREDADALAKAITRIIDDTALREAVISRGQEDYLAHFSQGSSLAAYKDLIVRLCAEGG